MKQSSDEICVAIRRTQNVLVHVNNTNYIKAINFINYTSANIVGTRIYLVGTYYTGLQYRNKVQLKLVYDKWAKWCMYVAQKKIGTDICT